MRAAKLLWTAGGLGLLPLAPGTWGTLAGVAVAAAARPLPGTHFVLVGAAALLTVVCVPLARAAEAATGRRDPGSFVLDEVAGYLVAVLGLPLRERPWLVLVGAFVCFRLFDIAKPPPIRRLEQRAGAVAVVADDLVAGIYANVAMHLVLLFLGPR
ncbi:MAG: phosphatidylglycerophosphatase A family protein [Planctomycetota bacterium]